jgi:hypothetical protein
MTASPYLSLVKAFQAEVTLTVAGPRTDFCIRGPSRKMVDEELARLLERATARRATFMYLTAFWGRDWICHGEIYEALGEKG